MPAVNVRVSIARLGVAQGRLHPEYLDTRIKTQPAGPEHALDSAPFITNTFRLMLLLRENQARQTFASWSAEIAEYCSHGYVGIFLALESDSTCRNLAD